MWCNLYSEKCWVPPVCSSTPFHMCSEKAIIIPLFSLRAELLLFAVTQILNYNYVEQICHDWCCNPALLIITFSACDSKFLTHLWHNLRGKFLPSVAAHRFTFSYMCSEKAIIPMFSLRAICSSTNTQQQLCRTNLSWLRLYKPALLIITFSTWEQNF